jgi:hydrogenase-4 component F
VFVAGLLIAFAALMLRLQGLAFGEPSGSVAPVKASYVPMVVHFGLVLVAGFYMPPLLVTWFEHIAGLLG